jgi:D-lactate dehydrogenase
MKLAFYSTKPYDETFFNQANKTFGFQIDYLESRLRRRTVELANGADAVCAFVNDSLSDEVLTGLSNLGVKLVALRCAGFNKVDLEAAKRLGMTLVRVPAYSPYAVAEHAIGLMMTLNRKYHRAYNRVREGNFSLVGLEGFDMHGKTVGIIGTGKIGETLVPILLGFGCNVVLYDVYKNPKLDAMGLPYLSLDEVLAQSDILSLHCPLVDATYHLINHDTLAKTKKGVMIINTSRGGIVDTDAVIDGLKSGQVGSVGLDVYEEEDSLFFRDLSNTIIQDDRFMRLLSFPNVVVTGHQAFFTQNALTNIAHTTLNNLAQLDRGEACPNTIAL